MVTKFVWHRINKLACTKREDRLASFRYPAPCRYLWALCEFRPQGTQGSVLGPLLYILYTADLAHIVASHSLSLHHYADDCQVYMSVPVDGAQDAVDQLSTCLVDVEAWLKASRLRLYPAKTQVMWLGSQHLLSRLDIVHVPILSSCVRVQDTPGRRYRQPAVSGRACCISFPQQLLPTATVAACGPVFVERCHEDVSPCFHCQSLGLL